MPVVTPTMPEIFEEAFERAGLRMESGGDLRTIRRSLNILMLEWQNRGINMFTVDSGTLSLTDGTALYSMPSDTIDLIEHQIREGTGTDQSDYDIERISVSDYAKISSKNTKGRPTSIYVDRQSTGITVTLWPVPDSNDYSLAYYRLAGIDGISSGIGTTADVPPRFVPALISGLAFHIAMKRPEVSERVAPLREDYEYQYQMAAESDRDKFSTFFRPWVS